MTSVWQRRQYLIDSKVKAGVTVNTGEGGGAEGYYSPGNNPSTPPTSLGASPTGWGPKAGVKERLEAMRENAKNMDPRGMGPDGIRGPSPLNPNASNDASSNPAFGPESIKDTKAAPEALGVAGGAAGVVGTAGGVGLGMFAAQQGSKVLDILNKQGSIHDYTPDEAGGSGGGMQPQLLMQMVNAINKLSGQQSRL